MFTMADEQDDEANVKSSFGVLQNWGCSDLLQLHS